jgi:hypothetical protein
MMSTPARALLLATALLATASATAAAPTPTTACGACAHLQTFDSTDANARATVFAKSCDQVVTAQSQGADAAKVAKMHAACVAVQSSMFDPLMLCTDVFRCDSAEVAAASVKTVLSTPVMEAAAFAIPPIPCDMCENALPLLKALSTADCKAMMVAAVTDMLQQSCGFVCQAALGYACSSIIPVVENNPKVVCRDALFCDVPANPMPSVYPLDCKKCIGTMTLAMNIPADKCPGFMPGVLKANGVPPDPNIINFVCKDALPILAKKNPADTCNEMLMCTNTVPVPTQAALRVTGANQDTATETAATPSSASAASGTGAATGASAWIADNAAVAVAVAVVCGLALLVLARVLIAKCRAKPLLHAEADDANAAAMPAVSYAAPQDARAESGHHESSAAVDVDVDAAAGYAPPTMPAAAAAAEVPLLDAACEPAAGRA